MSKITDKIIGRNKLEQLIKQFSFLEITIKEYEAMKNDISQLIKEQLELNAIKHYGDVKMVEKQVPKQMTIKELKEQINLSDDFIDRIVVEINTELTRESLYYNANLQQPIVFNLVNKIKSINKTDETEIIYTGTAVKKDFVL